ncbi:hypothetical protein NC653_033280 [Populus alba x Populus x berolinensis]|uniref:Uncharacterized protein n=1 Tax=Populus alba x Populus x berolinensis TaxID=444605 RepID=A0AAD6LT90_9ROSI|nr:hypothetical protein NC653_033280 [Populus alba x Populus x berolinensis]
MKDAASLLNMQSCKMISRLPTLVECHRALGSRCIKFFWSLLVQLQDLFTGGGAKTPQPADSVNAAKQAVSELLPASSSLSSSPYFLTEHDASSTLIVN